MVILYIIIIYDISVERVNKVCQFLRRYLNWVQNSAFEGELSEGLVEEMKIGLNKLIKKTEDSVIIFSVSSKKWLKKEVLGVEKNEVTTLL